MSYANAIYNEIVRPTTGVRVPTFPERRRTAILGQQIPVTTSVGAMGYGETDVVLTRDPNFPLWVSTPGRYSWQAAYAGMGKPTWSDTTEETVTDTCQLVNTTGYLHSTWNPDFIPSDKPASLPHGQCPLAVFQEQEPESTYVWVPTNSTVTMGISLRALPTAGAVYGNVCIARRISATAREEDLTFTFTSAITSTSCTQIQTVNVFASMSTTNPTNGVWVRIKEIQWNTGAAGFTVPAYQSYGVIRVDLGLSAMAFSAPTATTNFSVELPTEAVAGSPALWPIICPFDNRSYGTGMNSQISSAVKMIGCALSVENATAVKDIEGTMSCLRFIEGDYSLAQCPRSTQFGRFMPQDKITTRLATGLYTFVRPDREFREFQNSTVTLAEIGAGYPPVITPVMNIWSGQNYHLLRMADMGTSTVSTILLNYQYSIEFITTDILLNPKVAPGVIHDTEAAVLRVERTNVFLPRARTVEKLVDRSPIQNSIPAALRAVRGLANGRQRRRRARTGPNQGAANRNGRTVFQNQQRAAKPQAKPAPQRPKMRGGMDIYMERMAKR